MLQPEQIAQLRDKHYNATLVGQKRIHEELVIFQVKPDFAIHAHQPGQYTTLGLGNWEARVSSDSTQKPGEEPKLIRRQYSIAHPLADEQGRVIPSGPRHVLEFYIVHIGKQENMEAPELTPRLFRLKEGDRLFLGEKILGHYTLEGVKPDDTVVFLSTGTGEAPNNYMLWHLLMHGHRGKILAVCCVRFLKDLGYRPAHEALMRMFPQYQYIGLATREPGQPKKYIQELLTYGDLEARLGKPLDPASTHVFLCGNPQMIGAPVVDRATKTKTFPQPVGMVELLERRGLVADSKLLKIQGQVHFEEYW